MEKRSVPGLLLSISVFLLVVGGLLYIHYGVQRQAVVAEVDMAPGSPSPDYPDRD